MGVIHINKLKPGMILDQEVRDINGRLLLKSDKEIQSSHIRIFKTWGVTEVNIRGNNESRDTSPSPDKPQLIEINQEKTKELFQFADLEHPAIKEIFKISVLFRCKYNFSENKKDISFTDTDTGQKKVEDDFLQKLTKEKITQPEQLFVSGLLHDLGRLILYSYFPKESQNLLSRARSADTLLYQLENDYLGCNHTHLIQHLLKEWKLPMTLVNNVFFHHNPYEAQQPVPATLVHLADIISNGLGIDTSGERFVPPLDHAAWANLGLSPTCFDLATKQAIHQFFALESILDN